MVQQATRIMQAAERSPSNDQLNSVLRNAALRSDGCSIVKHLVETYGVSDVTLRELFLGDKLKDGSLVDFFRGHGVVCQSLPHSARPARRVQPEHLVYGGYDF